MHPNVVCSDSGVILEDRGDATHIMVMSMATESEIKFEELVAQRAGNSSTIALVKYGQGKPDDLYADIAKVFKEAIAALMKNGKKKQ